jgi:hypothetical protein
MGQEHGDLLDARRSIEERLFAELTEAENRFKQARKESESLRQYAHGSYAVLKAADVYSQCLGEYQSALKRFCDFTLRGKIPPEMK